MKAGIYSPYWDTLGGGEYYAGSVAKAMVNAGYDVDLFSTDNKIINKLNDRFNIGLRASVNAEAVKIFSQNVFKKKQYFTKYDILFFVSDGSIPFLFAKKNILHFQVPFRHVNRHKLINSLKFTTIHHVVCNSQFTKNIIDQEFRSNSTVVYPAVNPISNKNISKNNIILSVGRFDNLMQSKRQDVLIDTFKKMDLKNWRLVLVGGVLHGNKFVEELKNQAKEYPIEILANATFQNLQTLYAQAKIFWHAAGYGFNIEDHPQKAEHFGISTVEAMSAGAIPVVFNGGGLKEIVDVKSGYLWNDPNQLIQMTRKAIDQLDNQDFINQIKSKSHQFSTEVFNEKFQKIIG